MAEGRDDDGSLRLDVDTTYQAVTGSDLAAAVGALQELCSLISMPGQNGYTHYIRIAHFEHGAFLSAQLTSFAILDVDSESYQRPPDPVLGDYPNAVALRTPGATTPDKPFTFAVVANHPVETQIMVTLVMLSTLVDRQEMTTGDRRPSIDQLNRLGTSVDSAARQFIADAMRAKGWRHTVSELNDRARQVGIALHVDYSDYIFDVEALRRRAPVLRYVYNELPEVRHEIDKFASMLSETMYIQSPGTERSGAIARTSLDASYARTYLAHLARDAFVCGNGFLDFGNVPDEDIRLLNPESTTIVRPDFVANKDGAESRVLHIRGGEQVGGLYGVSVLEPFVRLAHDRQIAKEMIDRDEAWRASGAPPEVIEGLRPLVEYSKKAARN